MNPNDIKATGLAFGIAIAIALFSRGSTSASAGAPGRPGHRRRAGTSKSDSRWRSGTYAFRVTIPENDGPAEVAAKGYRKEKLPPGVQAAAARSGNGYDVELAIPVAILAKHQGENWTTFQMTPIVIDVDDVSDKPARLIWRGTKDVDRQNTNFGHFVQTP